jgi:uncharacterized DUF497 family protein
VADILFEWDEEKNKVNQQRHGIRFEDAKFVFNDPGRVILPDLYHSEAEEKLYHDHNNQAEFERQTNKGTT